MLIPITWFRGVANDYRFGGSNEISLSKHFDILTYPNRLQPLRGMATESTTDSEIGNIIVGTNGNLYGVGTNPADGVNGKLWVRADNNTTASSTGSYSASSTWRSLTTNQLSGVVMRTGDYNFLVDYPDAGNVRTMHWASTNLLIASDPLGASSATTQALTFSTISNGFVHPKDKILYFGYQTGSGATYIGKIASNATPFAGLSTTALQLPSQYQVTSLSYWNNYLTIACSSTASGNGVNSSVVFLWDRDTSLATVSESIPWGGGKLVALNNLNGVLVGVSSQSAATTSSVQDSDSVFIKTWNGGSEPIVEKEIIAQHTIATLAPSVLVHPNVNFICRNRLYFSVDIIPTDGSTATYGLWSVGRGESGRFVTTVERMATNTGTETGVLAAAIAGDFVSIAHTAVGTLTYTINGATSTTTYGATSVIESCVNPNMKLEYRLKKKKLMKNIATFSPLVSGQSVVLKYRVDCLRTTAFTTIATASTVGDTRLEMPGLSDGTAFTDGTDFEFALQTAGGVFITGWAYVVELMDTQI